MENDDQDIIDAEHLIQDDTCSEGEDEELDAKISVEHEKFRQQLLAAQTKQLRARSAPAIGSPSSAKQRKRSAERMQASQLHVETNSPREEFVPAYEKGCLPSRLGIETSHDSIGTEAAPSRLETVDEEHGMRHDMAGKPDSPAANAASPVPQDPYAFAMELLESDLESPIQYYKTYHQRPTSAPGLAVKRSTQSSSGPSTLAAQGLLGLIIPAKRDRSKSDLGKHTSCVNYTSHAIPDKATKGLTPGSSNLTPRRPQSAKPFSASPHRSDQYNSSNRADPHLWGNPDKDNLPRPRHVMQFLEDMPSKGFQPSGWNEDYAAKLDFHVGITGKEWLLYGRKHPICCTVTINIMHFTRKPSKVRCKIQEANQYNLKLGLRSKYKLVAVRRIGAQENVAVEVSSQAVDEEPLRTISVQAFLNTHNRLRKLATMRRRPHKHFATSVQSAMSPALRNQAEIQTVLRETAALCSTLGEQVAILKRLGMQS